MEKHRNTKECTFPKQLSSQQSLCVSHINGCIWATSKIKTTELIFFYFFCLTSVFQLGSNVGLRHNSTAQIHLKGRCSVVIVSNGRILASAACGLPLLNRGQKIQWPPFFFLPVCLNLNIKKGILTSQSIISGSHILQNNISILGRLVKTHHCPLWSTVMKQIGRTQQSVAV